MKFLKHLSIAFVFFTVQAFGQTQMSLEEALDYAKKHSTSLQSSQLDIQSAEVRMQEIKRAGLPQVSGSASVLDNLSIQTAFLPARFFNQNAPEGTPPVGVKFGVKYSNDLGISVNQLIFDASYLVGLKAAATYRELVQKQVVQSEVNLKEAVSKAYYSTIVAEERIKILAINRNRLDSLLRDMKIMNQQGFIEKLDIDRIEVQNNNLRTEQQKIKNLIDLSYAALKFQMGMPLEQDIKVNNNIDLNEIKRYLIQSELNKVTYSNRIEFKVLDMQRKLAELDVLNKQRSYWPQVVGFLGAGFNQGRNDFSPFEKWYDYARLGISLKAPIYDSGLRRQQIEQARLTIAKINVGEKALQNGVDFQAKQAQILLKNALENIQMQERNMDLAKQIVRTSKLKYQQGVGTNLEVLNAESSLKESETNYFAALYDVLVTKVDLDKAYGKL